MEGEVTSESGDTKSYRLEYTRDIYVSFHVNLKTGLFQAHYLVLIEDMEVKSIYSFYGLPAHIKRDINHEIQGLLDPA